ncbi:phage tail tube protein [uncultured Gimesia sp.]|uniref:phage tail tube protein n=1 Tax=uncultured Gimesia sp. TaxID=1678688 RepID=UPI0030DA11D5|tara:strand:+ start:95421 stop:96314 length:894 start_codon:yes stop_codon:yes gene_type:complete
MTLGIGTFTRVAIDSALPFDTSSIPIEIVGAESLVETQTIDETGGTTGTTEHISERTRLGQKRCSGTIQVPASRLALDTLLPLILGAAESSNVFALADTLPEFVMMIDRDEKVYTYSGCRIARATFSGSSGQMVMIGLDIEAETETEGDAGTFPALETPTETPYRFEDGVLTLQSSTREFNEFSLVIENQLDTERFENNLTRVDIPLLDRIITLGTNHPWSTANLDLIKQDLAGAGGSLVLTNTELSSNVLTFTLGAIQYPTKTPGTQKAQVTRLPLEGMVRKVGTTASLVVTNAHA